MSGLVRTSSLCARCPVEVDGAHIQSESDMPTFARVEGDLEDRLALCQSRSYRLPREEIVVS